MRPRAGRPVGLPLVAYFCVAYLLAGGAWLALAGGLVEPLLSFPLMVVGVGLAGPVLTALVEGRRGLRRLGARMARWRVGARWYLVLLVPPGAVSVVLLLLGRTVSPAFAPGLFPPGLAFGAVAGFFEELGWSGYAFPRMAARLGTLRAGVLLGVLWGSWHAPVVDHLGAAGPHGTALPLFFLAFVAAMTAMRVLIGWVYAGTGSLLLAQLLHVSSTASLVVLGPPAVSPGQEALWYAAYAAALWGSIGCTLGCWWVLRAGGRGAAVGVAAGGASGA